MNRTLLHTPDGMRDVYGKELENLNQISEILSKNNHLYGYEDISTPALEFLDVFSKDMGTISSKELYQFFDREGNTLCLRPDFTPAIARCAAKYYMEEDLPLRFSYDGNAFVNNVELQGKLKETRQLGVELINDPSIDADVEVISLVIEGLLKLGLKDFQISLGNSDYFRGICKAANFDEETENVIKDYILSKNYFALLDYVKNQNLDVNVIKNIESISKLFMSDKDLEVLKEKSTHPLSVAAIDRLLDIKKILEKKGYDKYISFDLSMISKHYYYTGVILKCYTYGVGDAIVKGGRYNELIGKFGKEAPAIGCVFLVDEIMNALNRQNIELPSKKREFKTLLVYTEDKYEQAMAKADSMRADGISVTCMRTDSDISLTACELYAKKNNFNSVVNA